MHRRAEEQWWWDEVAAGHTLGYLIYNSDSAVGVVHVISEDAITPYVTSQNIVTVCGCVIILRYPILTFSDLHIYENSRGNKKILYTNKSVLFVQLLKHFPLDRGKLKLWH